MEWSEGGERWAKTAQTRFQAGGDTSVISPGTGGQRQGVAADGQLTGGSCGFTLNEERRSTFQLSQIRREFRQIPG